MDRRKALMASTIVTVTLVAGAAAFAANSGLVGSRSDNVGSLQPAAVTSVAAAGAPTVVTVFIDPVSGAVVAPPATIAPTPPAERGENEHEDEREEGHGDD